MEKIVVSLFLFESIRCFLLAAPYILPGRATMSVIPAFELILPFIMDEHSATNSHNKDSIVQHLLNYKVA